ncbi:MAG: hypothetical protein AB8B99_24515 [Phormidesmis sp.]
MRMDIVIGIGFAFLAILLGFLSYKKVLGDGWLDRADKVASVVSFIIAISSVFGFFSNRENTSSATGIRIGGNSNNSAITQGNNNSVTVGDITTTAENRSIAALERVKSELISNFGSLSVQIETIQVQAPQVFWDTRRANETELAYQDRAKNEFRDYERFIQRLNNQIKFSGNLTNTFQKDLAFQPEIAQRATQTYEQQQETRDSFVSFESELQNLLRLNLTDEERTAKAQSLHLEKVANAKMSLANAASYFCLIANSNDIELMRDTFARMGIDAQFQPGEKGYKAAKDLAAKFAREKAEVLNDRINVQSTASQREVDRRINDPYILMLRKAAGLPSTLTKAEVERLRNREIDKNETEPVELFTLAAFSYLESDGKAAIIYFERALSTGELSERQSQYAKASIDRLKWPERYGESLGVMITELSAEGSFAQAGLRVGDVIISLEREAVNEPIDIASAIAKAGTGRLPITIIRDEQKQIVNVQGGKPAAAQLSPLVIPNIVQL